MQSFRSIHDLLVWVQDLHRRCCVRFARARQECAEHRYRALLEFLRDREAEQFAAIARLIASGDDRLRCFVQRVPEAALQAAATIEPTGPDFDAEVLRYRQRDRALIGAYEQLAANVGHKAGSILRELLSMRARTQARLREALIDS